MAIEADRCPSLVHSMGQQRRVLVCGSILSHGVCHWCAVGVHTQAARKKLAVPIWLYIMARDHVLGNKRRKQPRYLQLSLYHDLPIAFKDLAMVVRVLG